MRYRDPRARMWAEACELLEQAERLQRQFFRPAGAPAQPAWEPPIDVFETERELRIVVALPGVGPEDVRITAQDGMLIVTGERPLPPEWHATVIHRIEIPHGRFERRIKLPVGRFELGERELGNGCLSLTLRKLV